MLSLPSELNPASKKPTGVQLVFNFIAVLTTCSKNNYLNFAGTRKWTNERHRLARSGGALGEDTDGTYCFETSRSIIRAAQLRRLPVVHLRSSHQVVCLGSSSLTRRDGTTHPGGGFALRCFQRLSLLDVATQRWGGHPNWLTSGPAISVLSY